MTSDPQARAAKEAVRERVWELLVRERASRFPGAHGRIPNFAGAERAARLLETLPEWRAARVVKANPDAPQLPVRRAALASDKTLYMAVPRLRAEKPFLRLLGDATIKARGARPTALDEIEPIDVIVCGSVVVNRAGVRVGKGGGYSDLEFALLVEHGLVDSHTTIMTTVHALQVVDEDLPETDHDFSVDVVVTPDDVVRTSGRRRPGGILWDHLDEEKVAAIPVLARHR